MHLALSGDTERTDDDHVRTCTVGSEADVLDVYLVGAAIGAVIAVGIERHVGKRSVVDLVALGVLNALHVHLKARVVAERSSAVVGGEVAERVLGAGVAVVLTLCGDLSGERALEVKVIRRIRIGRAVHQLDVLDHGGLVADGVDGTHREVSAFRKVSGCKLNGTLESVDVIGGCSRCRPFPV